MKFRIPTTAVFLAVALLPARAMAAEEAAGGGSWIRLLFFVFNFSLFVGGVIYFASSQVRKFFSDRSTEIRGTLSRADAAFRDAQDLANSAASRMAGLEAEKARMKAEFDAETAYQIRAIGEMAKAATERIKRDAEMTAAAMADSAQRRVRHRLAAGAAQIARSLITRNFQDTDQARLLEGLVDKLRREART